MSRRIRTAAEAEDAVRAIGGRVAGLWTQEVEPWTGRSYLHASGIEVRAWRVRMPRGERTYRVAEFDDPSGHVLSERGLQLACYCPQSRIRKGHCEHAVALARAIGGRDVVAERWAEQEARGEGARAGGE